MSLTELRDYLAQRGVHRSRKELQRRCQAGQIGRKIGTQWAISSGEAQSLIETLGPETP